MARELDEDVLDTQDEEVEQEEVEVEDQEEGDGDSDSDQDDPPERVRKPFLEVDERTKYMTADDAKRGFSEAGKRIAALSAWEKELKEYDVSPTDVRTYLDELIESRQTAAEMKRQLEEFQRKERESSTKSAQSTDTKVSGEAKLTREEKDAVDWLKQQLPSLGYISKEDALKLVKDLQDKTGKIDAIEAQVNQQNERYRNSLINEGRTKLSSWLADDQYSDDEDGSLKGMIEGSIRDWINASEIRTKKFYEGGSVTEGLLKEGYDRAKKALGMVRAATNSSNGKKSDTYVKNKADALKRNVKRLPNQDITQAKSKNLGKLKKKIDAGGHRDYIGEKHDAAWEKFRSITNKNEDE